MKTEGKESHIYRLHSVCMHAYLFSRVQFFATSWTVAHQAPLSMGFFSGKNSGMGFHFLLQGIFPTQGSNLPLLCLLHCRQIFHPLSHWKSPFYVSALNFFSFFFFSCQSPYQDWYDSSVLETETLSILLLSHR